MSTDTDLIKNIKSFMKQDAEGAIIESINSFAKRLGMPQQTVHWVLRGNVEPTEKTIERFAKGLNSTPEYLRYRRGPRHVEAERQEAY